jgi:hypothetical protein
MTSDKHEISDELEAVEAQLALLITAYDPEASNEPTREVLLTTLSDVHNRVRTARVMLRQSHEC